MKIGDRVIIIDKDVSEELSYFINSENSYIIMEINKKYSNFK